MLNLKGKLKRLNSGMPRDEFWAEVETRRIGDWNRPSLGEVRALVASAFVVRPEYEAEIAASVQMLCDAITITPRVELTLGVLGRKGVRAYAFGKTPLALETNRGWLVYPLNIRHVNWQLSRRRD